MRENGRNSVRRPQIASLTDRNREGFSRPGNRVGLPGLDGGRCRDRTCDPSHVKGRRHQTFQLVSWDRTGQRTDRCISLLQIRRIEKVGCDGNGLDCRDGMISRSALQFCGIP